jgi:hypothetical protein
MAKTHTSEEVTSENEKEESVGYILNTTTDVLAGSSKNSGGC